MIQQFGESLETRWYREHSLRIHKKHLEAIRQRSKSTIKSPLHHISVNLRKISQENDKKKEIIRENMILSTKLYQIHERRVSPGEAKGPKSLNFSLRKKEADKILTENYDFVRRFMVKPSFVSASKLEEEYKQQLGYKKTISKANLHKRLSKLALFDGKPGQLPPLEASMFDHQSKSRTEVQSKLTKINSNNSEIVIDAENEETKKKALESPKKKTGKNILESEVNVPESKVGEEKSALSMEEIKSEGVEKNEKQSEAVEKIEIQSEKIEIQSEKSEIQSGEIEKSESPKENLDFPLESHSGLEENTEKIEGPLE